MVPDETPTVGRHRRLADSDDSDDDTPPETILTTAKASDLCPRPFRLVARNSNFTSLEDLSPLSSLDYIDLTGNRLTSLYGLERNPRLKTLILKNNRLDSVTPLLSTSTLRVLDLADNLFVSTDWLPRAAFAAHLIALVIRGNRLVQLEGLSSLRNLQTLVISGNAIEDMSAIGNLAQLVKLSASNNAIRVVPPSFARLAHLAELRLAHNRIATLPGAEVLGQLASLRIVDIGHNRLTGFEELRACGERLVQVNLKGNPGWEEGDAFREGIRGLCARVEVIDGRRVAGGRRKVRVNRLRKQVGLPLEPERKYARPPSAYYIKKAGEAEETGDDRGGEPGRPAGDTLDGNATGRMHPRESAGQDEGEKEKEKEKEKAGERKAAQKRRMPLPEDEDEGVDAEEFVRMARARNMPGATVDGTKREDGKGVVVQGVKGKRRRTGQRRLGGETAAEDNVEFGTGGWTKW